MPSDQRHGDGEGTYAYIVSYTDDAERKRLEYLFNNWEDGHVEKPDGLVRIASGVDHDGLYEQIVGKVPDEQVESFALTPVEADVEQARRTVEQRAQAPRDAVESFVEYILSKKKAVIQSAAHNEYEVYTKKGRAEVTYEVQDCDDATKVMIEVRGYPPAPGFLAEFFENELTEYASSQQ